MLGERELARYDRQVRLPEIGEAGQRRLKQAHALVAGAGGLGSIAAAYLAAAGVGRLRVVDCDKVALSDLNRQIIHADKDIGRDKIEVARERLQSLNPEVEVEAMCLSIAEENFAQLVAGCDLIIDGLDNLATRHLLNRAAIEARVPMMHGAVYGFEGRATTVIPGETPCLWCLYPQALPVSVTPVLGTTPAIIGCVQANEAIKYITGSGVLLAGRLFVYDGLAARCRELAVERAPNCQHCRHLFSQEGSG